MLIRIFAYAISYFHLNIIVVVVAAVVVCSFCIFFFAQLLFLYFFFFVRLFICDFLLCKKKNNQKPKTTNKKCKHEQWIRQYLRCAEAIKFHYNKQKLIIFFFFVFCFFFCFIHSFPILKFYFIYSHNILFSNMVQHAQCTYF